MLSGAAENIPLTLLLQKQRQHIVKSIESIKISRGLYIIILYRDK